MFGPTPKKRRILLVPSTNVQNQLIHTYLPYNKCVVSLLQYLIHSYIAVGGIGAILQFLPALRRVSSKSTGPIQF